MDLLPCPFCQSLLVAAFKAKVKPVRYQVYCKNCKAAGPQEKLRKDAISWWNRIASLIMDDDDLYLGF